jgi:hypothetical protein
MAKELKDINALAQALSSAAGLAYNERETANVERFASEVI